MISSHNRRHSSVTWRWRWRRCSTMVLIITMLQIFHMVHMTHAAVPKRVLLTDIDTITLVDGRFTTGRRSAGVPQMSCIDGPCSQWRPSTIQCRNQGSDGMDVQWKCEATDMPDSLKFGRVEVVCEGYDFPDDPYILGGSCGLEYTLQSTGKAANNAYNYNQQNNYHSTYPTASSSSSGGGSWLIPLIIVAFIVFLIYQCCRDNGARIGGGGGGGGGGAPYGGDQPGAAAPPPPSAGTWGSGYSGSHYGSSAPHTSSSSGPGFWSGMAAGGAMGYMAGNRRSQTPSYSTPSSSSSWGRSSGGVSSSSSGSGTRTATAFGGTRRR